MPVIIFALPLFVRHYIFALPLFVRRHLFLKSLKPVFFFWVLIDYVLGSIGIGCTGRYNIFNVNLYLECRFKLLKKIISNKYVYWPILYLNVREKKIISNKYVYWPILY